MPDPLRRPSRIGLIGGECTGKSVLARALAEDLPACLVAEELRRFVDGQGRPPTAAEQPAILRAQRELEDGAAEACRHPCLVADPAPLMTAVYSLLYFDDGSLLRAGVEHAAGYDLVVWCAPDIPWVPDPGQRDGPAQREAADALIAAIVEEELEPRGIRVIRVDGAIGERVAAVRRAWQP
jgi:nicotinamide riboside kinase